MSHTPYRVIFFGTPDFAVPTLEAVYHLPDVTVSAVFTQPDKPVGRKQLVTPPPVKASALKHGLPVFQPESIRTEAVRQQLQALQPDVVIIVAYGKIIPADLLAIPAHGWLNVHASLLPRHRGAAPVQAAILAGDAETGVTLMKIDAGLDTGEIIGQKGIKLTGVETGETLLKNLSTLGAELVSTTLADYLAGNATPAPQTSQGITVTRPLTKEQGKIDWSQPAETIERQIRAYYPWPGAYTFWQTGQEAPRRIKILSARPATLEHKTLPGQVHAAGRHVLVGTGSGTLELSQIQLSGKRPQSVQEFLKGAPAFAQAVLQ